MGELLRFPVPEEEKSRLEASFEDFILTLRGMRRSPNTLDGYRWQLLPFIRWVEETEGPVAAWDSLDRISRRDYMARLASEPGPRGKILEDTSLLAWHKAFSSWANWSYRNGYPVDPHLLVQPKPRVERPDPTLYDINQINRILAACKEPHEYITIRTELSAMLRISEVCGLSNRAPEDGVSDLHGSISHGHASLRVRQKGGAKGRKTRSARISQETERRLARYVARDRPRAGDHNLILRPNGEAFDRYSMSRLVYRTLSRRLRFRIHSHGMRATGATIATKLGWNYEQLRHQMGHVAYDELYTYTRLSETRDLGPLDAWEEFVLDINNKLQRRVS